MLERSIVSIEPGTSCVLELHEMNRDSCFIKVKSASHLNTCFSFMPPDAMHWQGIWRRGCLCVCHVDVLCPDD